jgi:CBS domain containing-hemolysin-like protein
MAQSLAIVLAFFLVALNAFFVATEFAIVKVRSTRLAELSQQGNKSARLAEQVVGRLDAYLSATQLGITLASLGLGWVGEPAFAHLIERWVHVVGMREALAHTVSLTTAFVLITFLHIIFGELAPKSIAIQRPDKTTLVVARPIILFYKVFYPAIWALNGLANLVLKAIRLGQAQDSESGHSEEELQMLLTQGHSRGNIPLVRQRLLQNVFTFGRRTARQIMIPRADVVFLSVLRPYEALMAQVRESGHTRYPVCEGELDKVLGTVHIKDMVGDPASADIRTQIRPPLFVPETMSAERLLLTFQENRQHMAIVVDEYGGASGLVTLEDVLEELVGEVQDEFDEEAPQFLPIRRGGFLVGAGMLLEAVAAQLGVQLEEDDREADTIGGYVQLKLGQLGRVGDEVPFGNYVIRVVETRGRRLLRLLILPEAGAGSAVIPAAAAVRSRSHPA